MSLHSRSKKDINERIVEIERKQFWQFIDSLPPRKTKITVFRKNKRRIVCNNN